MGRAGIHHDGRDETVSNTRSRDDVGSVRDGHSTDAWIGCTVVPCSKVGLDHLHRAEVRGNGRMEGESVQG
jgi:hypothetical protein